MCSKREVGEGTKLGQGVGWLVGKEEGEGWAAGILHKAGRCWTLSRQRHTAGVIY